MRLCWIWYGFEALYVNYTLYTLWKPWTYGVWSTLIILTCIEIDARRFDFLETDMAGNGLQFCYHNSTQTQRNSIEIVLSTTMAGLNDRRENGWNTCNTDSNCFAQYRTVYLIVTIWMILMWCWITSTYNMAHIEIDIKYMCREKKEKIVLYRVSYRIYRLNDCHHWHNFFAIFRYDNNNNNHTTLQISAHSHMFCFI